MTYRYRQPAGLLIPAADAPMLAAALRGLQAELRRDGQASPARLLALLADAEGLTSSSQSAQLPTVELRWITAAEAAEVLGLSERYVRSLPGIRRRTVGRRVLLAEVDVLEELGARAAAAGFRCEDEVA